jgi:DinB family protein
MDATNPVPVPADPLLARPAKPVPERVEDLLVLDAQLDAIRREADALTAGLTDEQFNWQPDPTRWSIALCLQHLVVAADGLLELQEAAIDRARRRGLLSDGPYRHGRIGSMITASIEPPAKRRFKTARALIPSGRHTVDSLVPAFQRRQDSLRQLIARARGIDLGKTRVPLPGLPVLRLSLGQSFAFTLGHERRHLWQARAVREEPAFPR